MLSFQQAVNRVRSFYDGDTEADILMRLVETIKEEVSVIQDDQDLILGNLAKVTKFMEKLNDKANQLEDPDKELDDRATHITKSLRSSIKKKTNEIILEEDE